MIEGTLSAKDRGDLLRLVIIPLRQVSLDSPERGDMREIWRTIHPSSAQALRRRQSLYLPEFGR